MGGSAVGSDRPCAMGGEMQNEAREADSDVFEAVAPLPAGQAVRAELYNFYHVLNHANLFGAGYASQARSMIEWLLAEAGG